MTFGVGRLDSDTDRNPSGRSKADVDVLGVKDLGTFRRWVHVEDLGRYVGLLTASLFWFFLLLIDVDFQIFVERSPGGQTSALLRF